MRVKKSSEFYSARTAKLAKKIGYTILTGGSSITMGAAFMEVKGLTILSAAMTLVGTMITSFFTDEPKPTYTSDATNVA